LRVNELAWNAKLAEEFAHWQLEQRHRAASTVFSNYFQVGKGRP